MAWLRLARDVRQARGQQAERLACEFLKAQGFVIERTNVRFPVGEIDIIAREGEVLCFVEVRSTSSLQWGGPLGSITERKRRHLIRAATWYLSRLRPHPPQIRFDVVGLEWRTAGPPRITLVRRAFDAD